MDSHRKTTSERIQDIMQSLEKKARALIPFSSNLLVGDRRKTHLLMVFNRHKSTKETKKHLSPTLSSNLTSCITDQDLIIQHPNGTTPTYLDANTLFAKISKYPYRISSKERKNKTLKNDLEITENIVKNAVNNRVGNCHELTSLLYLMLRELNPKPGLTIRYEIMLVAGRADHEFIIINRDPNSNPNNMHTWGPEALICDPWLRETVNVSHQLKQHPEHQANIITFLLVYRDEPWEITLTGKVNDSSPHSDHWYKKNKAFFIDRHPEQLPDAQHAEQIDKQVTTLLIAVKQMQIDIVAALLNYGVNANPPGMITPLIYAVVMSKENMEIRAKVVELLLKAGATPHQQTPSGQSLLDYTEQHQLNELNILLQNATYTYPKP